MGKNKLTGFLNYEDSKIVVKNSNIRNLFLDGKLNGEIEFGTKLKLLINSLTLKILFKGGCLPPLKI